eukprot:jgi/Mesen1/3929/ME000209S02938
MRIFFVVIRYFQLEYEMRRRRENKDFMRMEHAFFAVMISMFLFLGGRCTVVGTLEYSSLSGMAAGGPACRGSSAVNCSSPASSGEELSLPRPGGDLTPKVLLKSLNDLRVRAGAGRLCDSTELSKKAGEWLANLAAPGVANCSPATFLRDPTSCYLPPAYPRVHKNYTATSAFLGRVSQAANVVPTLGTLAGNATSEPDAAAQTGVKTPAQLLADFDALKPSELWRFDYGDVGVAISDGWIAVIEGHDKSGLALFCSEESGEVNSVPGVAILF